METNKMTNTERQVIELIAADRIYRPISSIEGKLKRMRPKLARAIDLGKKGSFQGDRTYARLDETDRMKSRTMKEAVANFTEAFPRYGKILSGYIEEQRALRETNLYFGTNPNSRLTADDYMKVMGDMGFTETGARNLYPELMNVSRNLAKKRKETERSILVNSTLG